MNDVLSKLALKSVLNAAGPMTFLGASAVSQDAIDAAVAILPLNVEMPELHRAASHAIASATGSEAGCVTACAASGITIAVAASMTGDDLGRIERLPDTEGLKDEIVLMKGHNCHFSGGISQMVRLAGACVTEIGAVNRATRYQLETALGERTAAALYVVSHQTAQVGMILLEEFCLVCRSKNIPVIVDASAEYDLCGFLEAGADLVIYSAHKYLGGLTAGIIAGRKDLVRACYLQEFGIGRAMKVGKEGIASTIAVLEQLSRLDKAEIQREETARSELAADLLRSVDGLAISFEADPTGNPVMRVRIKVDEAEAGLTAADLNRSLAAQDPAIYIRGHDNDPFSLLLDPCALSDDNTRLVCQGIANIVKQASRDRDAFRASLPPAEGWITTWPDPPPRRKS